MEVSFGAKYINSASVKKISNKMPINLDTAIVELETKNAGDWYALEWFADKLSQNNSKSNYAVKIRDSFNHVIDNNIIDNDLHHYLLTSQLSDFEHLDAEKVLGTFMVADKRTLSQKRLRSLNAQTEYVTKIRFLQGSPESYYDNPVREHSGIGKAMLDFIKDKFKKYDIVLHADKTAIPFYLSQGFEHGTNPSAGDMMIYRNKNFHAKNSVGLI